VRVTGERDHHRSLVSRLAAPVAWAVAVTSLGLLLGPLVAALLGDGPVLTEDALWTLAWVGFPISGAIVASRRPRHPVGWTLLGIGSAVPLALQLLSLADRVQRSGGDAAPPALLGQLTFIIGLALIPTLVLLFPSGRLPSPGWRTPAACAYAWFGLLFVAYATRGFIEAGGGVRIPNPLAVAPLAGPLEVVIPILFIGAIAITVAVIGHSVWRFVRARGSERQQLKWFVSAAALFPVLMMGALVTGHSLAGAVFATSAWVLSLNGMAAGIAIAVMRYRLYDIDRVVSRTFSYAVVVTVLGLLYWGTIAAAGPLLRPFVGSSDLGVAVSTLAVAAAFGPVLRRVRSIVDHRFNRRPYDAARTVEEFAARLRDELDLEALGAELVRVTETTMQPGHISLWLREDRGAGRAVIR